MLAPVQDSVLDHPIPTFLEKQYSFKQHSVVFSAKKVIGVSKWKTGFIQIWPISLLPLRFKRWFLSQKCSTWKSSMQYCRTDFLVLAIFMPKNHKNVKLGKKCVPFRKKNQICHPTCVLIGTLRKWLSQRSLYNLCSCDSEPKKRISKASHFTSPFS